LEIEFMLRKTDREPTTIRNKPSKPEVPGSNSGRHNLLGVCAHVTHQAFPLSHWYLRPEAPA